MATEITRNRRIEDRDQTILIHNDNGGPESVTVTALGQGLGRIEFGLNHTLVIDRTEVLELRELLGNLVTAMEAEFVRQS